MATEILFVVTTSLTKLSILAFYLRVFSSFKTFKILTWIGIVYTFAFAFSCVMAAIFQCTPVEAFW